MSKRPVSQSGRQLMTPSYLSNLIEWPVPLGGRCPLAEQPLSIAMPLKALQIALHWPELFTCHATLSKN